MSGGISGKLGCPTLIVGGVEDHVHILMRLARTISIADWVMKTNRASTVRRYIANQERHHKKMTFQDEYRKFLSANDLSWDERFAWD